MAMREALRRAGFDVPDEPRRDEDPAPRRDNRNSNNSATCDSCGKTFNPRHPSHKLCNDCFRPQRRASGDRSSGGGGSGGQPGQRRQRDRRRPRNAPPVPALPTAYFDQDDEGEPYLLPAFVSRTTLDPLAQRLATAHPPLTTGQMRRFFNHCRQLERRLNVEGETWQQVSASFEALSAHAQNASSGQSAKIPIDFQRFIDGNVMRVSSSDDPRKAFLDGFMPHFEALVGFGAAYMRDR